MKQKLLVKSEGILVCPYCGGDELRDFSYRTQSAVCKQCKRKIPFEEFR